MKLWYPELLKDGNTFPAHMLFTFFERGSTAKSSIIDQVHLYMPEQFGQPNTVSWDVFPAGQSVVNAMGGGARSIADFLSSAPGMKYLGLAGSAAQQLASGAASDLMNFGELASGKMLNPYLTQLFRGVDFRNFQFTFRFVPFTEKDCDTILSIVNTFRKWSLPEGPKGGSSVYLHYPGEVEIEYIFNGERNRFIHKFKRSIITSIDVDYTGAGMWTMMRNGFPTETVMNISFAEIQIVVRKDVEEGY